MDRTLVFHSYKGGTGKTTIAANLAALYAQKGRNVCMFDFDFRAPSLNLLFGITPKKGAWLNDFLNEECEISDMLYKVNFLNQAELDVGFANPSSEAMWEMNRKDQKWWAKILRQLLETKRKIFGELGFDLLVFDTSPGIQDSSMNALAVSDLVLLTLRQDELDAEGTKELAHDFHGKLGCKTAMILNRVLFQPYTQVSSEEEEKLTKEAQEEFGFPVIGVIPCYCDLSITGIAERGEARENILYSLKKPNHQFVKRLSAIADRMEKL